MKTGCELEECGVTNFAMYPQQNGNSYPQGYPTGQPDPNWQQNVYPTNAYPPGSFQTPIYPQQAYEQRDAYNQQAYPAQYPAYPVQGYPAQPYPTQAYPDAYAYPQAVPPEGQERGIVGNMFKGGVVGAGLALSGTVLSGMMGKKSKKHKKNHGYREEGESSSD